MSSVSSQQRQWPTTGGTKELQSGISSGAQMNLAHASGCSDPTCPLPFCINQKMAVSHARTCTRTRGNCNTCSQVSLIAIRHAKSCRRDSSCPVPLCLETKVKLQYMKLTRELDEHVSTSARASSVPSCDSQTLKRARTEKSQQEQRKPNEGVLGLPMKVPRHEKESKPNCPVKGMIPPQQSHNMPPCVVPLTSGKYHGSELNNNRSTDASTLSSRCHFRSEVLKAPDEGVKQPWDPLRQAFQQLVQVLAFPRTHEQEMFFVWLLKKTLHEAEASVTSSGSRVYAMQENTSNEKGQSQELQQQL